MSTQSTVIPSARPVPESLRPLFWEHDFDRLSWDVDAGLIIGRVLSRGTWPDIQWLRRETGDGAIREWITQHAGRGLSPRQLRFWQVILGLRKSQVDVWLREPGRQIWDHRTSR